MNNPNFIDYVSIYSKSGDGGEGSKHFRREKFVPKAGPDGGDGGRGGHIILNGNKQLWTLLNLKYKKHFVAENGKPGGVSKKNGANGKDCIIKIMKLMTPFTPHLSYECLELFKCKTTDKWPIIDKKNVLNEDRSYPQ